VKQIKTYGYIAKLAENQHSIIHNLSEENRRLKRELREARRALKAAWLYACRPHMVRRYELPALEEQVERALGPKPAKKTRKR
jgi:hypothetical protein